MRSIANRWEESTRNGYILCRDETVAMVVEGNLQVLNAELLPLYLTRNGDVEGWLTGRAINFDRTNGRLLKKALGLSCASPADVALRVHAANITDTYWFREFDSTLQYSDVRFLYNDFADLALRGDPDAFNLPYSHTGAHQHRQL